MLMLIDNPPTNISLYLKNGTFKLQIPSLLSFLEKKSTNFTLTFVPSFSRFYNFFNFSLLVSEQILLPNYTSEYSLLNLYTFPWNEEETIDSLYEGSNFLYAEIENSPMYAYQITGISECIFGQIIDANGICSDCSFGSFSVLNSCVTCPDNMVCKENTLFLNPGYWKPSIASTNSFICSQNPERCL